MMNANSTNSNSTAPGAVAAAPASTKPLWIAIGVLGASVLAMAATLVQVNKSPAAPTANTAAAPSSTGNMLALAAPLANGTLAAPEATNAVTKPMIEEKAEPAQVLPAQAAPKKIVKPVVAHTVTKPVVRRVPAAVAAAPVAALGTAPVAAPVQVAAAPQAVQAPAPVVCGNCATVVDVTAITRKGKGSGVGAVAGGVLGGVLGHQVGQGTGKDLATVIGAVGGGIAGHQIERNARKETVYQVRLRMDDGSTRTTEVASAPGVGAKVTVDGGTLRSNDGSVYAPAPKEAVKEPRRAANGDIMG
jgi:outer membrane lipoprotein SlyB